MVLEFYRSLSDLFSVSHFVLLGTEILIFLVKKKITILISPQMEL